MAAWQQYTQERLALKEAARKAFGYWAMKSQADAFQTWQACIAEHKACSAAAARAMQYFTNRTAASAFLTWRDFTDERAALKSRLREYVEVRLCPVKLGGCAWTHACVQFGTGASELGTAPLGHHLRDGVEY